MEDLREDEYTCVCPEGKKGKCSGKSSRTHSAATLKALQLTHVCGSPADGHSLTFSGSSYVKYHLTENENKELMKLSLRLRTFSSHATVMYAKGTDYSILEVGLTQSRLRKMIPQLRRDDLFPFRGEDVHVAIQRPSHQHMQPSVLATNSHGFKRSHGFA